MSELRRCDFCGKEMQANEIGTWLRVQRTGAYVLSYAQPEGPWDFDSLECIELWAQRMQREGA
jgi:hypothetical protein